MILTYDGIKAVFVQKKFRFFELPNRLNIVGIRTVSTTVDQFDDWIGQVFLDDHGQKRCLLHKGTTDPGLYYLKHPMDLKGCAVMVEGQYQDAYSIGYHLNKYEALIQIQPIKVYRDGDKDNEIDYDVTSIGSGLYGCNIHRAWYNGIAPTVGENSAGCAVIQNPFEYNQFMQRCHVHADRYGNLFDWTLIHERDFDAVKVGEATA